VELELVKYQALGNDFLVVLDPAGVLEPGARLAAALCDRHRGIGADGLVHLRPVGGGSPPPAEPGCGLWMQLRNADGGVAETSGNGLRCAALAAIDARLCEGPVVTLLTVAGPARAEVLGQAEDAGVEVRVDMGPVVVGSEQPASSFLRGEVAAATLRGLRARQVQVGNPHLVVYDLAESGVDEDGGLLERLGPMLERAVPGGVNVELVTASSERGELSMQVWERGVGPTLACGSGSVAAAAAARATGLVGGTVRVVNPGGVLAVELSGGRLRPSARLSGPARRVARCVVELDDLEGLDDGALRAGAEATA
jgi:diaminopimelate epimerase